MKKLIAIFILAAVAGVAVATNDYVSVMYSPSRGQIMYGGSTNAPSTNLHFNSISVGNMTLSTNGITVTNNYGWEDLRFPVGVAAPVTPNADVALDVANNAITFSEGAGGASTNFGTGSNVDHVWGVAQFPHTWRTNSAVSMHVHFNQRFSDETNCWYMYYRFQPIGLPTNSAWTFTGPASNLYAFNGTNIHQMAVFGDITLNGNYSSILDWKIFALGSAVSNDLIFKEFDIHYQIERTTGEIF